MALYCIPCAQRQEGEAQSVTYLTLYVNAEGLVEAINKVKDDYQQIQTAQVVTQFKSVRFSASDEIMPSYSVGYPTREELVFAKSLEELATMMDPDATGFSLYTEVCKYIE